MSIFRRNHSPFLALLLLALVCAHLPQLAADPYLRPELRARLPDLRPHILAAAARHNRPALSQMDDNEFAAVIALIIFNEQNGWLEDAIEPLRAVTPLYQNLQARLNCSPLASNFSVWPSNLRPSVALEIINHQLPVPDPVAVIAVPVEVTGSAIAGGSFASRSELYAALTSELIRDDLAIEFLAANLERGLHRAHYEGVAVNWRTLAAWHNQGIVAPRAIQSNPTASDYLRRASAYLDLAHAFVGAASPSSDFIFAM